MNPFAFERAASAADAVARVGARPCDVRFIAGGTNLLDLMKEGLTAPDTLVDINALPLGGIEDAEGGGLRIGALARNADTAWHPAVRQRYPLLAQALLAGASPQLRNMATTGGNLLQRTRCYYFYDASVPCNKRKPGSGCPAIGGVNRIHAIQGASDSCIAVHPSDMCVAMAALDATVQVQGAQGSRGIAFADFHRLPGDRPDLDTTLAPGELITSVDLPAAPLFTRIAYLKIRDRRSYAFALVSVAAALDLEADGRTVKSARIALGGVAHKPWRLPEAETLLAGATVGEEAFGRAADALLAGARGQGDNDFKIPLARRTVVRALLQAAGQEAAA
ncbi:FAD binding domain-containing protein [Xylophilus ampelinus]|uniref:Xanthine dehydrogenase YagS FAD-binding subunit n=1 Tax=Xylophilus ampelinus TaxID=54067 RepID=A0A318SIY8_9BURK|nr:xanthine dehydrogenase family protein subunit M [Xylophilus ampelinus]MCS4511264.1 xanthine dehydrogenase family protein subunit M [Xylophilus ampelinus]PYE74982.1 xanthine dehydrogenase YagS FAD-binding subunit [Xylophilus ampelinus]